MNNLSRSDEEALLAEADYYEQRILNGDTTQNNTDRDEQQAPERLWVDARIITTPSMRVLYGEPPPEGAQSVEYVRADIVSRASIPAVEGDAIHWCLKAGVEEAMCGVEVRGSLTTFLSDAATCEKCKAAAFGYKIGRAAAASSPAPAEPACKRCADDANYLPAYYDEEVKAWLHRGRDNEGYLCRLKHPNGFTALAQPEGEQERRRTWPNLPICPDCQQGYICEHCGKPIGDYYDLSVATTSPSKTAVGGEVEPDVVLVDREEAAVKAEGAWANATHLGRKGEGDIYEYACHVAAGLIRGMKPYTAPLPAGADNEGERARWLLTQIVRDLPVKRDWLDPAIEKEARELIGDAAALRSGEGKESDQL